MINKKKTLGKYPNILGERDAIHVPIVSVRAGSPLTPGQKCCINEYGEAVKQDLHNRLKTVGIVDPFLKFDVITGENFWLLVDSKAIPSVVHYWEHPDINFSVPTRDVEENKYLAGYAKDLGVTYHFLFSAMNTFINENEKSTVYEGKLTEEELEEIVEDFENSDVWYEWAEETGHEFENYGSECCPEHDYPYINSIFTFKR
jgi:hypothetical protein